MAKMSPIDKGKNIWDTLYSMRYKISLERGYRIVDIKLVNRMVDVNKDVICTYKIMDADCMTNSEVRREIEDKFQYRYCDNKIELL